MVATNEWNPDLDEKDEESAGPVIFGVSLNDPKVIGIAIGVLGALAAGALVYYQILPTLAQNNQLKADIETTTQEVAEKEKQIKERAKAEDDLAIAKQKRADVAALFASEKTMETLLYDVNRLIDQLNTGITDETKQAMMLKFAPVEPTEAGNYVVTDGSLGPLVNGKLKRRDFKVEFEGSYQQVRDFLIALERMQPLLITKNLRFDAVANNEPIEVEWKQNKFVPVSQPEPPRIKISFDLNALLALSEAESLEVNKPPAPAENKEGTPPAEEKK